MTTWIDVLVLLLRGSGEVHTGHVHPIMGTPCDVPLPSMITSMASRDDCDARPPWQGSHRDEPGPLPQGKRGAQNAALPGVRAKGTTSRMFETPVANISIRSKPSPKPAWGTVPHRRRSMYQP